MIDRVLECDPGKTITAVKCFSRSEMFFMDHFPGYPIVPGVVQVEVMAQAGGICIRKAHPEYFNVLGSIKSAKFFKSVEPGDKCIVKVEILKLRSQYALARGIIEVDGKKVSETEVMYGIMASGKPVSDGSGLSASVSPQDGGIAL